MRVLKTGAVHGLGYQDGWAALRKAAILEGLSDETQCKVSHQQHCCVRRIVGVAGLRPAQAADNVRVRGTVASLEGSTLTVKTREDPTSALALKPGWKVTGVAAASLGDTKPGDLVGIASLPTASGGDGAIEVLIFPPAMKGTGEGSYPWDLKPKSAMTNGTVLNAVKDVDGRTLTVSYKGQEKTIIVPDGVPIVTFGPATETDLKPGTTVFVPAQRGENGSLTTGFVVVGTNGVDPPM